MLFIIIIIIILQHRILNFDFRLIQIQVEIDYVT